MRGEARPRPDGLMHRRTNHHSSRIPPLRWAATRSKLPLHSTASRKLGGGSLVRPPHHPPRQCNPFSCLSRSNLDWSGTNTSSGAELEHLFIHQLPSPRYSGARSDCGPSALRAERRVSTEAYDSIKGGGYGVCGTRRRWGRKRKL
ncbi:hypothetical protein B0H12DRAFT_205586 [Mycena haematopus]|nr:hypothetical protein B0H12DRAFT_205586 [Mycena haematopus]